MSLIEFEDKVHNINSKIYEIIDKLIKIEKEGRINSIKLEQIKKLLESFIKNLSFLEYEDLERAILRYFPFFVSYIDDYKVLINFFEQLGLFTYIDSNTKSMEFIIDKIIEDFRINYKKKIFKFINHEYVLKEIFNIINKDEHFNYIERFFKIIEDLELDNYVESSDIFSKYLKFFIENDDQNLSLILLIDAKLIKRKERELRNFIRILYRIYKSIITQLKNKFYLINLKIGIIFSYLTYFEIHLNLYYDFDLRDKSFIDKMVKTFFQKGYKNFSLYYNDFFLEIKLILALKLDNLNRFYRGSIQKKNGKRYEDYKIKIMKDISEIEKIQIDINKIILILRSFFKKPISSIITRENKNELNFITNSLMNNRVTVALPILFVEIEKILKNFINIIGQPKVKKLRGLRKQLNNLNKCSKLRVFYSLNNPYFIVSYLKNEVSYLNIYCRSRNKFFHSKIFPDNERTSDIIKMLKKTLKKIHKIILRNMCLLYLGGKTIIRQTEFIEEILKIEHSNKEIIINISFKGKVKFKSFLINNDKLYSYIRK